MPSQKPVKRKPGPEIQAKPQVPSEDEIAEGGAYFIRFPPERVVVPVQQAKVRDWPALPLMTDLKGSLHEYESRVWITVHTKEFKVSRDPLKIFEAFSAAISVGVYPPIEILQAVAAAFMCYLDAEGKQSLDQVFNLQTGQGRWSSFTKRSKRGLALFAALLIYECKIGLDVSTEEAARRVARYLRRQPHLQLPYTSETLARLYPGWKKRFGLDETDTSNVNHPDNPFNAKRRAQYLAMYGPRPVKKSVIPTRQRKCLQCDQPFASLGPQHRTCDRCRRRRARIT
jgi:hypothetical protein